VVINGTLNGEKYLELLQTDMSDQLETVDVGTELWFMQDGCPAHNYHPATTYLRNCFPGKVIGTHEQPLSWPARSPDLNPLDFFLWGHISSSIYKTAPFPDVATLQNAIEECCGKITSQQLQNVQTEFYHRLGYCVLAEGGIFEHLIK